MTRSVQASLKHEEDLDGSFCATPQKPEHLANEICALDSSKEQLLKEGEAWVEGWRSPAPAYPHLLITLSLCRETDGGKAGGCETSAVCPVRA